MTQRQVIIDYIEDLRSLLIEARRHILQLEAELSSRAPNDVLLWSHTPLELKRALDYCRAHGYDPKEHHARIQG